MKTPKALPSIVIKSNSDEVYGPIAASVNGEVGSLCFTTTTDGLKYHTASFPKAGIVPSIPDSFVTITSEQQS